MDKWKDVELEKMKVGGNRKAREFFDAQPDYCNSMSLLEKYNSKAAALYRDKVIINTRTTTTTIIIIVVVIKQTFTGKPEQQWSSN